MKYLRSNLGLLLMASAALPLAADGPHLSAAHQASRRFVIDPAYDALAPKPSPDVKPDAASWIYGDGQLEAWKLDRLVTDGFATNLHVDYLRNYGQVSKTISFRHAWPGTATDTITVRTNAEMAVRGEPNPAKAGISPQTFHLGAGADTAGYVVIDLTSVNGEPPALLIEEGPLRTDATWQWSTDGREWSPTSVFPQTGSGKLPHQVEEPILTVKPLGKNGDVYDFGVNLLARPVFRCKGKPAIVTGESEAEALAPAAQSESRLDVVQRPDGLWTSVHALGFRYLRVMHATAKDVAAEAYFHPVQYRGAFACSDDQLTRIWMNSAFTLRECMHGLMIDGIKRDRMPWIGDQASNLPANAYAFAEPEIVRESFTALGRPQDGYINNIVDYSLWWVISQGTYQEYFDDPAYLQKELPHIDRLLATLAKQADGNGMLRPPDNAWVFIDWGVHTDKKRTSTSLQIMWYWAQRSGAILAAKAGNAVMATRWKQRADALEVQLQSKGWNPATKAWQEYLEGPETSSPYPNFLALLAGMARPDQVAGIRQNLIDHPCQGTPFMRGFELLALARAGDPDLATQQLRDYWGGMLDRGATTFWEDFKPGEQGDYTMYKRPFGRSLCHAWASGPAAILPAVVLGVRPLKDGWKEFAVEPHLGSLKWASACVPTPAGNIEIQADANKTTIDIPAGLTLVRGADRHAGPAKIDLTPAP